MDSTFAIKFCCFCFAIVNAVSPPPPLLFKNVFQTICCWCIEIYLIFLLTFQPAKVFFFFLLFFFCLLVLVFLALPHGLWDFSSLTKAHGSENTVEVQSPNHWTAREFLGNLNFIVLSNSLYAIQSKLCYLHHCFRLDPGHAVHLPLCVHVCAQSLIHV